MFIIKGRCPKTKEKQKHELLFMKFMYVQKHLPQLIHNRLINCSQSATRKFEVFPSNSCFYKQYFTRYIFRAAIDTLRKKAHLFGFVFKENYGEVEDSYYLPSTMSVFSCKKNKCLENIFLKNENNHSYLKGIVSIVKSIHFITEVSSLANYRTDE